MTIMRATVGAVSLAYETFGDPSARPLLLISGLSTPMTRWTADFCQQLVTCGFYVIRYDNRDCGSSTHLDQHPPVRAVTLLMSRLTGWRFRPPYTLDEMADDAAALLGCLGLTSAHIVGRSMGGLIAQRLAYRHPLRVRSLALLMSTSGHRALPLPHLNVLRLMLARPPSPDENLEAYLQHRVAYTQAIGSRRFPLSDGVIRQRVLDDLQRRWFTPGSGRRQLMALLHAGDQRPILRKLKQPAIVIHGDADPLVPLACGMDIHRHLLGSKMTIIPDMGHGLHPPFFEPIVDSIALIAALTDPVGANLLPPSQPLLATSSSIDSNC